LAYTGGEDPIFCRVGGGVAFHDERVGLRAGHARDPGRGCDGAAVVVGRHDDGRDVAVACAAVGRAVGECGSCCAGEKPASAADIS
jgi:hypothetical protein